MDILTGIIAGTGFLNGTDETSHHHSEPDSMLGYSEQQRFEPIASPRPSFHHHPQYSCSNRTIMIENETTPSNLSQPTSPITNKDELLFFDKSSVTNRIITDPIKKSLSNNLIKQNLQRNNISDLNGNNDQDGQCIISITNPQQTPSNTIFPYSDFTQLSNYHEQNKNSDNKNNNYLSYGCSSDIGEEFAYRYAPNVPIQCDHIGHYTLIHQSDKVLIDNNNNNDNDQKLVKKSSLKKCSQFGLISNYNENAVNHIHYLSGSPLVNHNHIGPTHHLYHHHNHHGSHQSNSCLPKYNYHHHSNEIMEENMTMLPKKITQSQTQPSLQTQTHHSIVSSGNIEKPKSPKTPKRLLKSCKKHMEVLNFVLKGGPPWGFRIKQRNGNVFISKVRDYFL